MRLPTVFALVVLSGVFGCTSKTPPTTKAEAGVPALLDPASATEQAPEQFRVKMVTTKGDVVIEVHRAWAPKGADRFYNMVKRGFFDDVAFFRAIEGFMVQFGMHGDPAVQKAWNRFPIEDDPVVESNARGKVTFAKKNSPNSRTTQVFVNYRDNANLDAMGFAPFGEVIEGMDVLDQLHKGYGEGGPRGKGPAQPEIERNGNRYLRESFPLLDYAKKTTLVEQ
ncbi:MAG: peptidylprolyl isomerase [Deltaproteobacteria bacterium]|nr:peptidylprolyl isomerase [Deltaproteobacteria bacterium]